MKSENSNAFQCKKIVLCQQQTPLLHTLPISSIVIYLAIKNQVRHETKNFSQQHKAINQGLFYPFTVPISTNALSEKRNALLYTKIFTNTRNFGGL